MSEPKPETYIVVHDGGSAVRIAVLQVDGCYRVVATVDGCPAARVLADKLNKGGRA